MGGNNANITINVVEPGASLPVPDTGLFTHGMGGVEVATISATLMVTVAILAVFFHKKKQNKITGGALGFFAFVSSFVAFVALALNTSAIDNNIPITVEGANLTIEVGDEPVFAVAPVKISVDEATEAGYMLKAFAVTSGLVSTTNPDDIIPTITAGANETVDLADNTYGLALEEPSSRTDTVYYAIPEGVENALVIKNIDDYSATEANDETVIYYGFYITPDVPYGTYTGEMKYEATKNEANLARINFNGNGLYFDGDATKTANNVLYNIARTNTTEKIVHTPNIDDDGVKSGVIGYLGQELNKVVSIPGATKLKINLSYGGGYIYEGYGAGFLSFWQGSHSDYTTGNNADSTIKTCGSSDVTDGRFYGDINDENAVINTECEIQGDAVTFAYYVAGGGPGSNGPIYGYYATVTGYDEDGNIIYLLGNNAVSGEYELPGQSEPYVFLGWAESESATKAVYTSEKEIKFDLTLTTSETKDLYAVWQYASRITFDGNGNDAGDGVPERLLVAGKGTSLCNFNYYSKTGYNFNGWNTKSDGSGTEYGNCSWFSAPTDRSVELKLYAQWVPVTTIIYDGNGNTGGEMSNQTIVAGNTDQLRKNEYYREDYYFNGWNTKSDGSGDSYADEAELTAKSQSETITLYAQWTTECPANNICYRPNGANVGEGYPSMGTQTNNYADSTDSITSNMEVNLWPSNYKYDTNNDGYNDYGFAGWSEDADAASKILNADNTDDPVIYGPSQNITLGDVSNGGLDLYAVWVPVAIDNGGDELTFQTADLMTRALSGDANDNLTNKPVGYVTALRDYRDNQVYAVAKLADGKYWMIENLRLDDAYTVGNNQNNPDVTNQSLSEGYGGNFVGLAEPEYENFTYSTAENSLYSIDNIVGDDQVYRFPRYNNTNTASPVEKMRKFDNYTNVYSLGNYYTWAAAIADTNNYTDEAEHSNVKTSICPAGWRLPYNNYSTSDGSGSSEFRELGNLIDGAGFDVASARAWRTFPNNYVYSGSYVRSQASARANGAFLFANSASGLDGGLGLWVGIPGVNPGYANYKYEGLSVRCVAGEW